MIAPPDIDGRRLERQRLANDTGLFNNDRITQDPAINANVNGETRREATGAVGSGANQSVLVDGLHARSTLRWSLVPIAERH